jgi:hypothetical protein
MRTTMARGTVLAGALTLLATGCGSGEPATGRDGAAGAPAKPPVTATSVPPPVISAPVTAAPATDSVPAVTTKPVPTNPTGPSLRLSDGTAVAAVDPATGGVRAHWPEAALSGGGAWTVAVTPGSSGGPATASWIDPTGDVDHSGPVPDGLTPGLTSTDGHWAVFVEPAPPVADGEIGPGRTTSRLVVTDGAGWTRDITLPGSFAPDAFGAIEGTPRTLQLIEYLPPAHPTSYRVRTLDLATERVGLPLNLQDKTTPVDQTMAGTSRTQVYSTSTDLLFTLYKPLTGGTDETWEYGFVHTLAPSWGGVHCIDLPEDLGLEDDDGSLVLRWDQRVLFVVTSGGRIASIPIDDLSDLTVDRVGNLGTSGPERPVVAAGRDELWVAIGKHLMVVDPNTLRVVAGAELPAPVTALTTDSKGGLLAADTDHLRQWSVDEAGTVSESSAALALPSGLGPVARIVLP